MKTDTMEMPESATLNKRVAMLKENLDIASEKSKEMIKDIIDSCNKQAVTAVEANKQFFDSIKDHLEANGIDTTIIDTLYNTFGKAVELSEEVIDTIIDAHNNRIDLTVDFNKKCLEALKEQALATDVDFEPLLEILQANFDASIELSSHNMKGIIGLYNKHVNLTLNFNKKFTDNIDSQIATMSKFYKKRVNMYHDWVSKWWEDLEGSK